jgi:hypothetical protein
MCSLTIEVTLIFKGHAFRDVLVEFSLVWFGLVWCGLVFSYCRMCSLTIECVLLRVGIECVLLRVG